MTRQPLSQLDDWELVYQDQDLRGRPLLNETGASLGVITELIVDTDEERIDAIVLDNSAHYPARDVRILDGNLVLGPAGGEIEQPQTILLHGEELRVRKRPVETPGDLNLRGDLEAGAVRQQVWTASTRGPATTARAPSGVPGRILRLSAAAALLAMIGGGLAAWLDHRRRHKRELPIKSRPPRVRRALLMLSLGMLLGWALRRRMAPGSRTGRAMGGPGETQPDRQGAVFEVRAYEIRDS